MDKRRSQSLPMLGQKGPVPELLAQLQMMPPLLQVHLVLMELIRVQVMVVLMALPHRNQVENEEEDY